MMKTLVATVLLAGTVLGALAGGGVMLQCTNCAHFVDGGNGPSWPGTNQTASVFLLGGGETRGVFYTLFHCATCSVVRSANRISVDDANLEIAKFNALATAETNTVQRERFEKVAKWFHYSLQRGRNPKRDDLCPQCGHKWLEITLDHEALAGEPQTNQVLNLPCTHCGKDGICVRDAHLHWD